MDLVAVITAFGVGNATGILLKDRLTRRANYSKRRMETDRATYDERVTRLVRGNLGSFIRSNRCRDGEREGLANLIDDLATGAHQRRFLDKDVQDAWADLVEKSVQCGRLRLDARLAEEQIADYVSSWEHFMAAAKESFGPITETDCPNMRKIPAGSEPLQGAA